MVATDRTCYVIMSAARNSVVRIAFHLPKTYLFGASRVCGSRLLRNRLLSWALRTLSLHQASGHQAPINFASHLSCDRSHRGGGPIRGSDALAHFAAAAQHSKRLGSTHTLASGRPPQVFKPHGGKFELPPSRIPTQEWNHLCVGWFHPRREICRRWSCGANSHLAQYVATVPMQAKLSRHVSPG
jgi:hypothetical protein